jgi:WD40 repeat protein
LRPIRADAVLAMAVMGLLLSASFFVAVPIAGLEDDQGRGFNGNQEMVVDAVRHRYYAIDGVQGSGYISAFSYDLTTLFTILVGGDVLSVEMSQDGDFLYVTITQDKLVKVVDLDDPEHVDQIALAFTPLSVAAGPNGTVLVSSLDDTSVRLINASTDAVLWTVDVGFTGVLESSPNGSRMLAIASTQDEVAAKLYDVSESSAILAAEDDGDLGSKFQQVAVDWDDDRAYLVSASVHAVQVLSLDDLGKGSEMNFTGQPTGVALGPVQDRIYAVANNEGNVFLYIFNPDGSFVGDLWIPYMRTVLIDDQERYAIGNGRISLQTSFGNPVPAQGSILGYTPKEVLAYVTQGIPAIDNGDISVNLTGPNGTQAMPFQFQGSMVSAVLTPGLPDGTYAVNISWYEGSVAKWYDWQFVIDRSDPEALRPSLDLLDPLPDAMLDIAPTTLTLNLTLDGPMPAQNDLIVLLDGVNLTTRVDPIEPWVFKADTGTVLPGLHEVRAELFWDGGSAVARWNLTLLEDPAIVATTPGAEVTLTAIPGEITLQVSCGYPSVSLEGATLTLDGIEYPGEVDDDNVTFAIPASHWEKSTDPLTNWRANYGRHYASVLVQTSGSDLEQEWSFILEMVPPVLPLETHPYYGKFSIDLPIGWWVQENLTVNGSFYQLTIGSSLDQGITTLGYVTTEQASGIKDSHESLGKLIDDLLDDLSGDGTEVQQVGETQYLEIDGHSAAIFTLGFDGNAMMMRVGIVVSEAHDQFWMVIFADSVGNYNDLLPTYDAMIMSLDIQSEEAPIIEANDITTYVLVGVVAAIVIGLSVFLVLRRKK